MINSIEDISANYISFYAHISSIKIKPRKVNYLPLLVFLFAEELLFAPEVFALEAETSAFIPTDLDLVSLPVPTIFAPASTAPVTAPLAAPDAAPLITLVKMSVA